MAGVAAGGGIDAAARALRETPAAETARGSGYAEAGGLVTGAGATGPSSTSPPAASFAQAPPAAHAVAEQAVRLARRETSGEVEIRLDPPELGRVRLSLSRHDHALVVSIVAERPEVADLLRRHADLLGQSLAEAGHSRVDLQFGRGGGERDAPPGGGGPADLAAEEEPARPPTGSLAGLRGLDLRV
ncbi:hook-length control protein FliK [Albimonas pacifica]|uniref:Hook-length control protein FliK n=1 Tax=Albimonas pacifica TaxID=1114924 RepID=A0A1I3IHV8_9RHOB|nr:hook-length control protein FliK [Albimonas pacifica]